MLRLSNIWGFDALGMLIYPLPVDDEFAHSFVLILSKKNKTYTIQPSYA